MEIAAGLLDDSPEIKPDKHIFVELTRLRADTNDYIMPHPFFYLLVFSGEKPPTL